MKEFAAGERSDAKKQAKRLRSEPRPAWRAGPTDRLATLDDGASSIGSWQDHAERTVHESARNPAGSDLVKRSTSMPKPTPQSRVNAPARYGFRIVRVLCAPDEAG